MPELPLVERYRSEAEVYLRNRVVERTACVVDRMMMPELTPRRLKRALTGRLIKSVERRGKYVWLRFDRSPHLVVHFGMTGHFVYNATPRPKHWRIELVLDNGGVFSLSDARRFGRVLLVDDPLNEAPISQLGFDPWADRACPRQFGEALRSRSTSIKAILLDQTFAAGVGNWIADDVLYLARIDPRRKGTSLSAIECRRILRQLLYVVRVATQAGSHADKFPKTWLFHLRWGPHKAIRCTSGHHVRFETVGARTTAWVPAIQK